MSDIEKKKHEFYSEINPDWENHPNTIEYRRLMQEIEDFKQKIMQLMEQKGFTEDEKESIMQIIEFHSMMKESVKKPLIRVTEKDNLEEIENVVIDNGKKIADNMLKVLEQKMKQIMDKRR